MPIPSYYNQINGLSPKIWYRFNETSGTPVNSGSLSTTSTFIDLLLNEQTDVDGRAIYLNGSTSYIQLPAHASFALFNDRSFTVECWVKINNSDTSGTGDHTIFRLNPASSPHKVIDLKIHGNYNNNRGKVSLTSNWTTEILSSAIDNGQWHHIVYTFNTSSVKLYVDGQLAASTTPSNLDASFVYDTSTKKLIGAGYTGISQTTIGNYYKGRIDEFAAYDYELTSQNILDNFNAGASVEFADIPGTASALAIQPTITTTAELTASPMTADATGAGHAASTIDLPTLLDPYMSGLTLQIWYKFNILNTIKNYGTGLQSAFALLGGPINNVTGGIQGSGEFQLNDTESILSQSFGGTIPNLYNYENDYINDEDFTVGFWTKKQNKELVKFVDFYKLNGSDKVTFSWNTDGGITFLINANNSDYSVASTTDITDGEWHFVAGRLTGNTMELFIDGTSIGTATMNHTFYTDRFQFLGTNSTDRLSISHFFISTAANVTSTQISNMWDYGTPTSVQATAYMPEASAKFNSAFNDYIQSKSPIFDFRMDEGSGLPVNYGSQSLVLSSLIDPVGYSQGVSGLNTRTFNFTKPNQALSGLYDLPAGTLSTNDVATYGVLFKLDNKAATHDLGGMGGASTTSSSGNGFSLRILTSTGYIRVQSGNGNNTTTNYDGNIDYADDKWHLAVAVQEANSLKVYVDGKLHINQTRSTAFTDNGAFTIARIPGGTNPSTLSINKRIDEVFALDTALTQQEVFEAWQALRLEMDTTASASFPMPTNATGTGFIHTAAVTTASASFEMPGFTTDQVLDAAPGTASALFVLPNFGGNVVIDANYGHTAATASALFHDPQFQIGDSHSADHMNASALMVHPATIAAGSITVSTAVGGPAILVMPGIVTIKGAQHFAEPMRSNAIFPLPPAYIQLTDDDWFVRLLEGHADKKAEFIQGTITNLPNQASTDIIKGGFLSFFDDILADITQNTNPNYITSEIPNHYFDAVGLQEYDENGDLIPLDTTKNVARVTPSRGVLNPTPMVSKGYFDNQERKAVRIENIEIPLPGTSSNFSIRPYNIEFSFKTTKANQVIAYGQYTSPSQTNSRKVGAIGLYNGRIYLAEDFYTPVSAFGETGLRSLRVAGTVPHPINFTDATYVGYMLGNKNIADGQWHHVIIQKGYTDGRTQIWIDGKLDKQLGVQSNDGRSTGYANIPGSDASQEVRPYIVGFNSADTNLSSDFQTSAWNYYPGRFLEERDITLNYTAYGKWKPIKAEPMTATVKATDNNKGAGNKARALMLYWWPVTRQFGDSESLVSNDRGQFGPNDVPTFDTTLYTYDYIDEKPQDYYGWDIIPLSITGYKGMLGGDPFEFLKPGVLQSNGLYIDSITSAPRYLDVVNDIDLTQFDAIFFRNYPDQSEELDAYIREQFSDQYFNITEKDLYDNFIKSLRAAIDTGVSLFITNAQLAIDLGIVDKVEQIPDFYEGTSDDYAPSILPATASSLSNGDWIDVHRNNRLRVVNTIDGLTNESGYIWKDWAYFAGGIAGEVFSGEPDRPFISLENRPNGLQVGDTFVISDATTLPTYYDAVPFSNIKAGKAVTAFANTIRQGTIEIENPYKNYATSIAIEPGTILNGKALGGKIFVNFTERLTTTVSSISGTQIVNMRPSSGAKDIFGIDLIQDEWINLAYNEGEITLAKRNELLNASYNLDRRLEAEIAGLNRPAVIAEIQKEKTWDSNGLLLLTQRNQFEDPTGAGECNVCGGGSSGVRRTVVNKVKKSGDPGTSKVSTSLQWFTFEYSWQYPRLQITAMSMLTRGFRWLSNRIIDEGKVNRVEVMTAIATGMPMPVVTADKDRTVYAEAMLSNAKIVHAPGYALADVSNTTLPLTANASFGEFVKSIKPDVFTASALIKQPRISGIEEDEIVVYMIHVDPILYLREDIIK